MTKIIPFRQPGATAKDPVKRFYWIYDTFDDDMVIKLELYNYVIARCRLNYD